MPDLALNPRVRDDAPALLQALLQSTDYGVLMSDLEGQDIVANQKLGELFAVQPDVIVAAEPASVRAIAVSRVRDRERFLASLTAAYSDPRASFEDEIELTTEPPRVLRRYTGPVVGRTGEPIGRIWTFLDVTETRRLQVEVEAQLAARTRDFDSTASVLRAVNDLSCLAQECGSVELFVSQAAGILHRALQYDACAVIARRSGSAPFGAIATGPETHGIGEAEIAGLFEESATGQVELAPEGRRWLQRALATERLDAVPLRRSGAVGGVVAFGRSGDAPPWSSAPLHEVHVRGLADQVALALESYALQSDLRATLQSLRAAQQQIVEIEKLRTAGTLAASVAHDIRNIVTALQLELAALPDASGALSDQVQRFATLTHRLLAFSRPAMLDLRPTALSDLIDRVVSLVAGQADVCGVTIQVDAPSGLRPVAADPRQLEHLFVNLCLNAIQAMNDAGGLLTISARSGERTAIVEVTDTGCGIAPETQERLFDPFFTTRANGTGLGLFSCRRIVAEHGGSLTVRSALGQGTTFTVTLPDA